jgi:hypothetical protein
MACWIPGPWGNFNGKPAELKKQEPLPVLVTPLAADKPISRFQSAKVKADV